MESIQAFLTNRKLGLEQPRDKTTAFVIKEIMNELWLWSGPSNNYHALKCFISVSMNSFAVGVTISAAAVESRSLVVNTLLGMLLVIAKRIFIHSQHDMLRNLVTLLNDKNKELSRRCNGNAQLRALQNGWCDLEMIAFIVVVSGVVSCNLITHTVQTVRGEFIFPTYNTPASTFSYFILLQIIESISNNFLILSFLLTDLFIGNLYSQLIMHVEVIHCDLHAIDVKLCGEHKSDLQLESNLVTIIRCYQSLVKLTDEFVICMTPMFNVIVSVTVVFISFICIDICILIDENRSECFKWILYLLVVNSSLFYWCWVGEKLSNRSSLLTNAAFFHVNGDDQCSRRLRKLQLIFMMMVHKPLKVRAKPFLLMDYNLFAKVMKASYQFVAVFKNKIN